MRQHRNLDPLPAAVAAALLALVVGSGATAGASPPRGRLTVYRARTFCGLHVHARAHVSIRGFYVVYPFFGGPGPPFGTGINYETGYLFGHRMPSPLPSSSDAGNGLLVRGPGSGSSQERIPDSLWIRVIGKLVCAVPAINLRSWQPLRPPLPLRSHGLAAT